MTMTLCTDMTSIRTSTPTPQAFLSQPQPPQGHPSPPTPSGGSDPGRNPEGKTKPSLSDELLAGVTGGPAALWVVPQAVPPPRPPPPGATLPHQVWGVEAQPAATRPMNLFPPVYMLCAEQGLLGGPQGGPPRPRLHWVKVSL